MTRRHDVPLRCVAAGTPFRLSPVGCTYIKLPGGAGGRYQMTDKEGIEMPGMTSDRPDTEVEIIR